MKIPENTEIREQYREKKRVQIWNETLALLDKMPLREITVQKICDAAAIHRSTFYNHFYDIYDLLSFGTTQILKDWHIGEDADFLESNIHITVSNIVKFIEQYRNAIINISETKYRDEILSHTYTGIERALYSVLDRRHGNTTDEMTKQLLMRFLCGGFEKALDYWAKNRALRHEELEMQVAYVVRLIITQLEMMGDIAQADVQDYHKVTSKDRAEE